MDLRRLRKKLRSVLFSAMLTTTFACPPSADAWVATRMRKRSTSTASCAGASVGGSCWYYGAAGQSCSTVCATHGGGTSATASYAGSSGTDANCSSLLTTLGAGPNDFMLGGGYGIVANSCLGGFKTMGCLYDVSGSAAGRYRCTDLATDLTSAIAGVRRVCACAQ